MTDTDRLAALLPFCQPDSHTLLPMVNRWCGAHSRTLDYCRNEAEEVARLAAAGVGFALDVEEMRKAAAAVRVSDDEIRAALASLGKPGRLDEAIVWAAANGFLALRAAHEWHSVIREELDVERLARALEAAYTEENAFYGLTNREYAEAIARAYAATPSPDWSPTMPDTCSCGHVEDEHADNGTCEVDGCLCAGWEETDHD